MTGRRIELGAGDGECWWGAEGRLALKSGMTGGGLLCSRDSMAETRLKANLPASGEERSSSDEQAAQSPQDAHLGHSREAEAKQEDEVGEAAEPGLAKVLDPYSAFVTPFEWVGRH